MNLTRHFTVAALAVAVLLSACGLFSAPIINDLGAIEQAYTGAELTATAYIKLPVCGSAGATAVCSNPATVASIKSADNTAFNALSTARTAILAQCPSTQVTPCSVDLSPAQNAVAAFTAVTTGLKLQ